VGVGAHDPDAELVVAVVVVQIEPLVELGGVINVISSMLEFEIESASRSISLSSSSIIAG